MTFNQILEWKNHNLTERQMTSILAFFIGILSAVAAYVLHQLIHLIERLLTEDFLTKKKIKNDGQVPQYYVENNHPAIIEPAVFDRVQKLMAVRHPGQNRNSCISPFSSRIKCGECGS